MNDVAFRRNHQACDADEKDAQECPFPNSVQRSHVLRRVCIPVSTDGGSPLVDTVTEFAARSSQT